MPTFRTLLTAGALLGLSIPAVAGAAPARTGSATYETPYTWDGTAISGAGTGDTVCATPSSCDDTVVTLPGGDLTIKVGEPGGGSADLDLYVYKTDATGTVGTFVGSSTGPDAIEMVTVTNGDPGPYLVRVAAATALQGTYKGTASAKPSAVVQSTTPSQGPNAPGSPTPPATKVVVEDPDPPSSGGSGSGSGAAPTVGVAPPARTEVKRLHGTAKAAGGRKVAKVRVALVRSATAGAPCRQLASTAGTFTALKACSKPTVYLTAKGTSSWSLALRRALAPGSYVLFVKATDTKGRTGAARRVTFTVT